MEWTMPNASVGKPNMQDMQEGAYPQEKKKSVAGQFAAVKHRSETYCWTTKINRGDYGVACDKYWVLHAVVIYNKFRLQLVNE